MFGVTTAREELVESLVLIFITEKKKKIGNIFFFFGRGDDF
jgi:hypothetical protein